ncbi:sensor histidine kinase [Eremococcus coleocola]|uniref:sensor histidine kinase n=1 Tax=Eremococcus coleocola TaxID=88132 RepID=UPI00041FA4B3|nr:HAMP domain-containing sensor histidine kinase [Eremococcus coleocola]
MWIISVAAAIIVILIIYILSLRRALKGLSSLVEEKQNNQSNLQLTNQSSHKSLDPLIKDYNKLFNEIQASKQAIKRDQAYLDQTLHNVSHDIRTPLTISKGYVQQLRKSQPDDPYLEKIDTNLTSISQRLEDLLLYQDLLENQVKIDGQAINLSDLVKRKLMTYYDAFVEADFQVDLDIADQLYIQADAQQTERILDNLLGNVLQHGQKTMAISLGLLADQVYLQVQNQSKQAIRNLAQLTHRFYSEDLSGSEKSSGLGLYIVQELMDKNHGYLELDYDDTLFSVNLVWPSFNSDDSSKNN